MLPVLGARVHGAGAGVGSGAGTGTGPVSITSTGIGMGKAVGGIILGSYAACSEEPRCG